MIWQYLEQDFTDTSIDTNLNDILSRHFVQNFIVIDI